MNVHNTFDYTFYDPATDKASVNATYISRRQKPYITDSTVQVSGGLTATHRILTEVNSHPNLRI